MQCPNDNTTLQMTTREGIEIDYCPQCRGVWLDRGELDKLIERSNVPQQGYSQPQQQHQGYSQPPQQQHKQYDDDDDDYRNHGGSDQHRKHKKEGFLGDLFDF